MTQEVINNAASAAKDKIQTAAKDANATVQTVTDAANKAVDHVAAQATSVYIAANHDRVNAKHAVERMWAAHRDVVVSFAILGMILIVAVATVAVHLTH